MFTWVLFTLVALFLGYMGLLIFSAFLRSFLSSFADLIDQIANKLH